MSWMKSVSQKKTKKKQAVPLTPQSPQTSQLKLLPAQPPKTEKPKPQAASQNRKEKKNTEAEISCPSSHPPGTSVKVWVTVGRLHDGAWVRAVWCWFPLPVRVWACSPHTGGKRRSGRLGLPTNLHDTSAHQPPAHSDNSVFYRYMLYNKNTNY